MCPMIALLRGTDRVARSEILVPPVARLNLASAQPGGRGPLALARPDHAAPVATPELIRPASKFIFRSSLVIFGHLR
jgi:hypothetical protein